MYQIIEIPTLCYNENTSDYLLFDHRVCKHATPYLGDVAPDVTPDLSDVKCKWGYSEKVALDNFNHTAFDVQRIRQSVSSL